jgi:hypothetical protein
VPGCFLRELHSGGEAEFGVDVGDVGLHGAQAVLAVISDGLSVSQVHSVWIRFGSSSMVKDTRRSRVIFATAVRLCYR